MKSLIYDFTVNFLILFQKTEDDFDDLDCALSDVGVMFDMYHIST